MSMNSDKPTQWRTPDGVMRKIRLRKQLSHARRSSMSNIKSEMKSIENTQDSGTPTVRRQNPFAQKRSFSEVDQPQKKRILSCSDYERKVFDVPSENNVENIETDAKFSEESNGPGAFLSKNTPFICLEEDSIQGIFTEEKTIEKEVGGVGRLPVDWTIKRKARFLSKTPFSWCNRIKGAEEANGITLAARCKENMITNELQTGQTPEMLQKSWRIELGRCVTYWQHPSIPWLNLFPRFGPQQKVTQGGAPAIPQNDEVTKSLYDSWVIGFRSAYQLLRESLCPFFYVCAQQYTAIFRAAKLSKKNEISCMITPTTAGLRQSLKKEGIKFTQPLFKSDLNKQTSPTNARENKENEITLNGGVVINANKNDTEDRKKNLGKEVEEDEEVDHDEDAKWAMISEGIQFQGAKELRHTADADSSSRSAVLVTGNSGTQLLFNYLLNSRSSISSSGVQAHLSPTILSPVAFQGSCLQKLGVRPGVAKTYTEASMNRELGGDPRHKFSLDVSGPLLPHSLNGLTELLRKTQGPPGFQAAFSSAMYTGPFNTIDDKSGLNSESKLYFGNKEAEDAIEEVNNFGISSSCLSQLKPNSGQSSEACCVCQVSLSNDLYTWKI